MCDSPDDAFEPSRAASGIGHKLRKVKRRTALPFPNVDRYRLLKAATEVFMMTHCGVDLDDFSDVDLDEESRRLNRTVEPGDLEAQMRDYLARVPGGDGEFLDVLPYLGLIRLQLRDVRRRSTTTTTTRRRSATASSPRSSRNPCFLELIHSYWLDEGGLVQTLNAITWRFQNRTAARPGRDPLRRPGRRPAAPAQQPPLGRRPGPAAPALDGPAGLRVRPRVRSRARRRGRGRRCAAPTRGRGSSRRSTTCWRCARSSTRRRQHHGDRRRRSPCSTRSRRRTCC